MESFNYLEQQNGNIIQNPDAKNKKTNQNAKYTNTIDSET